MKAIGHRQPGPIERDDALIDIELPRPVPGGHDLLAEALAPQGKLARIDDPEPIDVRLLKRKSLSLSLHRELMFTRSLFHTPDMVAQHRTAAPGHRQRRQPAHGPCAAGERHGPRQGGAGRLRLRRGG